ncbi:helix-turn-helix transcriptional regulator [Aneurinibacillus sp. Ricciae_BoGa-3]|uniref:helix-turn-helix domain-containing protein n=1 Tax=Aneurinibacillus sp. Ricciae_BoGa-3 TaxID=3022697 RepID=UPI0023405291|nr:helix-turn-helix transcriptional regulator [Aneurinibacillus sp. Ricciae_BoGa-3]WCK55386.1 helix-turn-helix transcriptional regulator [Aneurinibacillus sp. Ricciae_BoGa-3]
MTLGERLRLLREKNDLTQIALAKKLNIPNQNISNYERDFRQPDYETLKKLADLFDVSVDYLLGRTDHPETNVIGTKHVRVADKEIELTEEEYRVFEEIKKNPVLFHDLASDPEKKVKALIAMWEGVRKAMGQLEERDDIIDD